MNTTNIMIKKPLHVFSKAENINAVLSGIFKLGILIIILIHKYLKLTNQNLPQNRNWYMLANDNLIIVFVTIEI